MQETTGSYIAAIIRKKMPARKKTKAIVVEVDDSSSGEEEEIKPTTIRTSKYFNDQLKNKRKQNHVSTSSDEDFDLVGMTSDEDDEDFIQTTSKTKKTKTARKTSTSSKSKPKKKKEEDEEENPKKKKKTAAKKTGISREDEQKMNTLASIFKPRKIFIGCHVSFGSKGVEFAAQAAHETGCVGCFALFVGNQKTYTQKEITQKQATSFIENCAKYDYDREYLLPHGSYLINLANPDHEKLNKSKSLMLTEMKKCEMLGLTRYNFHPGSTVGTDITVGMYCDDVFYTYIIRGCLQANCRVYQLGSFPGK